MKLFMEKPVDNGQNGTREDIQYWIPELWLSPDDTWSWLMNSKGRSIWSLARSELSPRLANAPESIKSAIVEYMANNLGDADV